MGCCFSFQPSTYEVQDAPNWDGQVRLTGTAAAVLHMSGNIFQGTKSTDMSNVNALLANAAQDGMRCVATYAPVQFFGKEEGVPFHMQVTSFTSGHVTSFLMFQVIDGANGGAAPVLETVIETVEITYQAGLFQVSASGFENMYAKLAELGAKGYSLSTVFDVPNLRRSGLFSTKSQVQIIAQRVAGAPPSQTTYSVTSVPINMYRTLVGCSADANQLMQVLQQQMAAGNKLASVFNPSSIQVTGLTSASTNCHLIFTPVAEPYSWTAVDINVPANRSMGGGSINYGPITECITHFVNRGWELGGVIPLPQGQVAGVMSFQLTARVIFQARTDGVSSASSIPQVIATTVPIPVAMPLGATADGVEMGAVTEDGKTKLIERA
jgi:hypothetical protein